MSDKGENRQGISQSEDPPVPRADWERNQLSIEAAFFKLMEQNKRVPTVTEIAAEIDMDWKTVDRHLEAMTLDEVARPLKALSHRVLLGQAKAGMDGNPAAGKLFFQIAQKFKEETVENVRDLTEISRIGETIVNLIMTHITHKKQRMTLIKAIALELERVDRGRK